VSVLDVYNFPYMVLINSTVYWLFCREKFTPLLLLSTVSLPHLLLPAIEEGLQLAQVVVDRS